MPNAAALRASHVSQSFGGGLVLDDLSLSIAAGEFVSLVGPSGCGKSTLLRLFAGLLTPTAGEITISGATPRIAFVFQEATLLPWRTVVENIALPLELAGTAREQRMAAVLESLELIGLTRDDAGKFPRELSGGMRMRVSLARALVTKPDVLLLDEPFAALDDLLRQQLNEELLRLWQEQRWTAVFVTHNVSEAVYLSERICLFSPRPGKLISEVQVPIAQPRNSALRATPEFAALAGQVSAQLRQTGTPSR